MNVWTIFITTFIGVPIGIGVKWNDQALVSSIMTACSYHLLKPSDQSCENVRRVAHKWNIPGQTWARTNASLSFVALNRNPCTFARP